MTEDEKALVLASLDEVGERCPDPTALVYARLFATNPQAEALFVMDASGAVRGHMLQEALQSLLDLVGAASYGANMIDSELRTHDGMGVSLDVFTSFYPCLRDTFRDIAGEAWTPPVDAAWDSLLAEISEVIARVAQRA